MVLQGLAPGVQHRDEADLGAEVTRVGSYGAQARGCAAEQDVVDDALVLQGDGGDRFGHGEDDMEVGHGQQVGLAGFQPQGAGQRLALGRSCQRFRLRSRWKGNGGQWRLRQLL